MRLNVIQGIFQDGHLTTIGNHLIVLFHRAFLKWNGFHPIVNVFGFRQTLFQPFDKLFHTRMLSVIRLPASLNDLTDSISHYKERPAIQRRI